MATTITVAIEKGGCGKTTTVLNLADLAGNEARVLCIDTDPQGNLTYSLEGTRITDEEFTGHALYDLYNDFEKVHAGEKSVRDYVVETNLDNVDLIPASLETPKINTKAKELIDAMKQGKMDSVENLEYETQILKYFVSLVQDDYDYIFIDTQPSRDSLLVTSSLLAADYILIPAKSGSYAVDSAFRTYTYCNQLREQGIAAQKGVGLIQTMVQQSQAFNITRENYLRVLGNAVFRAQIRFGKAVEASEMAGMPVVEYAKTQPTAKSYVAAWKELKQILAESEEN